MWNSKATNEEAGGKAWIHDISFCKDLSAPRRAVHQPPPVDRIVHGRCLPTPWIPTYPFDPYRRPNAPDTTGRSPTSTQCQMPKNECGTSRYLGAEFKAFENSPENSNVVIIDPTKENGKPRGDCCNDDPCNPCVPCTTDECVKDDSCQPLPFGKGDRTHFDDVKNTGRNRTDRYKIVPPWWNGERDDTGDDTPLNATIKKPDHAHLDPNREIGANCYAAAGLVTRPTLELPKPVRTFQGCPPRTAPPRRGHCTGRESKIGEFLGSHVARFDDETFPHYIMRCASVAKNELKKCRRLNVGYECCDPVDKFVTRLYIGSMLGQAAHGVNWSMRDACDVQRYLKEECRMLATRGDIDIKILSF